MSRRRGIQPSAREAQQGDIPGGDDMLHPARIDEHKLSARSQAIGSADEYPTTDIRADLTSQGGGQGSVGVAEVAACHPLPIGRCDAIQHALEHLRAICDVTGGSEVANVV